MPNWAYTAYKINGNKKQLDELHKVLTDMNEGAYDGKNKMALLDNGFGNMWLGNLVHVLGGDWNKIYCRGQITQFEMSIDGDTLETTLDIAMLTAWEEMSEVRAFLNKKFPSLTILYTVEEPGNGVYETNNKKFYNNYRYYLDVCLDDSKIFMEPEYFPTLEKVANYIKEHLGLEKDIEPTVEAITSFCNDWCEEHEDDLMCLNEFKFTG